MKLIRSVVVNILGSEELLLEEDSFFLSSAVVARMMRLEVSSLLPKRL
jgi:hypothetical protein